MTMTADRAVRKIIISQLISTYAGAVDIFLQRKGDLDRLTKEQRVFVRLWRVVSGMGAACERKAEGLIPRQDRIARAQDDLADAANALIAAASELDKAGIGVNSCGLLNEAMQAANL
ncbi:MAG: hypothetical protein ACI4OZ_05160 [Akkermansia sp.]